MGGARLLALGAGALDFGSECWTRVQKKGGRIIKEEYPERETMAGRPEETPETKPGKERPPETSEKPSGKPSDGREGGKGE